MNAFGPPKLHRGRIFVDGIWLPPGFSGRSLSESWSVGCQTLEFEGGCLVRFSEPIFLNALECNGVPLISHQGVLCSHQLPSNFAPSEDQGDLCLWWRGDLHWARLNQLIRYPMHTLVELRIDVQVVKAPVDASLVSPKSVELAIEKPVDLVKTEPPQEVKKPDRSWADVPELNPMLAKALEQARAKPSPPAKASESEGSGGGKSWVSHMSDMGLVSSVANLVNLGQKWMTSWLRNAQDDYLKQMIKHFEDGNWAEALRYGIPLDGEQSKVLMEYMGLLKPRDQLRITSGAGLASGIGYAGTNLDRMRVLYEKAFQDLSQQGRHIEAAFVLAELFHDSHRAVLYLEKHQLFREASDLAELRKLATDLRVRLLFKSGQQQKALELARQAGVFDQVYTFLKSNPELAVPWLNLWCSDLCARGQAAQSLLLCWSEKHEPELFQQRLEQALGEGTYQSGQVLAEVLYRSESLSSQEVDRQLSEWEESLDLVTEAYQGLAHQLSIKRDLSLAGLQYRSVCSRVCRQLLCRLDRGVNLVSQANFRSLAVAGEDRWLDADLPAKLIADNATQGLVPLDCWTETIERLGFTSLLHSCLLPDGRSLVALGEAGLLLLSSRGKVIQRLEIPVHQIIPPTEGQRYLLLSKRGPYQLLHWFVPANLSVERWCSTKLECWSQCHDGINWWVASEGSIYAIDVNSAAWCSASSFPVESAGEILRLVYRSGHTRALGDVGLFVLFADVGQQLQLQSHKLPSLDRVRQPFAISQPHIYESQQVTIHSSDSRPHQVRRPAVDLSIDLNLPYVFYKPWDVEAHSFHQSYSALQFPHSNGIVVCIVDWASRCQLACFNFVGSSLLSWQWQADQLLLTDDRGRFYIANLKHRWWDCSGCL